MQSSSSSSGSSRSGSPDTRATTPSSPASESKDCLSVHPTTWLCASSKGLTATALAALYTEHAVDGLLGLVLAPLAFAAGSAWTPTALGTLAYSVSASYSPPADYTLPYVPTAPVHAAHLRLFARAGLRSVFAHPLGEEDGGCTAYIIERPPFVFLPEPDARAASLLPLPASPSSLSMGADEDADAPQAMVGNIPPLAEWDALWAAWDAVTTAMTPPEMLHDRPIDLRHKCLFYIGHIPTFLDMLLSKAVGGAPTEPAWFWEIFERGIDPHVDDPDHCHNHSVVPTADADWPTLATVLGFRDGVRTRLRTLYAALARGEQPLTRNVARTLVMTFEHEAFHVETLLYILIQRAGCGPTRPPPGVTRPLWEALAAQWTATPLPTERTVHVPAGTVVLGHMDSEAEDFVVAEDGAKSDVLAKPGHTFGWDNESPPRAVHVRAFSADWRCVTNAEFAEFWRATSPAARPSTDTSNDEEKPAAPLPATHPLAAPASWVVDADGAIHVRTLFGPVPLAIAAHWPVLASADALALYAASRGGRLPDEAELRRFLDLYDVGYDGGANVGMRNWHPVPGTMGLAAHGGRGANGGVWEWTRTPFAGHAGLVPTALFTGYSADFFDGKHSVALGASYATLPRLGRRTLRNFYQHNYPYPWIGARVVYDD